MNPKVSRHWLTSSLFAEFCSGPVSGPVMKYLRATQLSRRKLQLRSLAEVVMDDAEASDLSSAFVQAWDLLAAAELSDVSVVEELLLHPSVGAWLARALRAAAGARLSKSDIGYLSSVAAAAAVRCRIPCAIGVPVIHGAVTLPTVGQASLREQSTGDTAELVVSAAGTVTFAGDGDRLPVDCVAHGAAVGWAPVKTVESRRDGVRLQAELDDQGPYREFSDPIPPRPLCPAEVREWERKIDDAWDLLVTGYRDFAEELSEGVSVIVPFGPWSSMEGASSPIAYGAIAVSRKKSTFELAETLIHEMQHSKLNTLLEFAELQVPGSGKLGYAPWRDDPRPTSGILHGVLAFTTAVEFWRGQRHAECPARRLADFHYAYRKRQVRHTIASLVAAEDLTDLGHRFVELLSNRLDRVEHDKVPGDVVEAVGKMTTEHRTFWRAQHVRPDPRRVIALADAWMAGALPPVVPQARLEVVPCQRSIGPSPRVGMLKALLLGRADPAEQADASDADLAYVRGDTNSACNAYADEIRSSPDSDRAWLAFGLAGGVERGNALVDAPELVLAVRDRLLAGGTSIDEPAKLVAWLDSALA